MCNRARLSGEPHALAEQFGARWVDAIPNANPIELFPKALAPVITSKGGQRSVHIMRWGVLGNDKAARGQGTNVRQLDRWRWLTTLPERRCLIPVSEFCEQTAQRYDLGDGKPALSGQMWFATTDQPQFAIAGFWQAIGANRHFAMVTCNPNSMVAPIHPKAMVTILAPADHDRWLTGSYDDVVALQRPYPAEHMVVRGPEFPTRQTR